MRLSTSVATLLERGVAGGWRGVSSRDTRMMHADMDADLTVCNSSLNCLACLHGLLLRQPPPIQFHQSSTLLLPMDTGTGAERNVAWCSAVISLLLLAALNRSPSLPPSSSSSSSSAPPWNYSWCCCCCCCCRCCSCSCFMCNHTKAIKN